jgi:hypothetical protein
MKSQFASIVQIAKSVRVDPKAKPIPSLGRGKGMTIAQVQNMAEDPMGTWFPHSFNAYNRALLESFTCDILVNRSPHPFLTSDNPAAIYHPPLPDLGFMVPPRGLESPGCEITMPLSPTHAVLFRHGRLGDHYKTDLDWEGVFEVNRRTITRAHSTIVGDRNDLFFVQTVLNLMAEVAAEKATIGDPRKKEFAAKATANAGGTP